jgi:type IV secretion system protein VirB1
MDLLTLAVLCGPMVAPAMTLRVIAVESAGHPYAIHDNTDGKSYQATNSRDAVSVASFLIRAGHRVDLGLMQINYDAWIRPTGFSLESTFDSCTNIRLGTTILSANYARALGRSHTAHEALNRALSQYNSGSDTLSWQYAEHVLNTRPAMTLSRPRPSVR